MEYASSLMTTTMTTMMTQRTRERKIDCPPYVSCVQGEKETVEGGTQNESGREVETTRVRTQGFFACCYWQGRVQRSRMVDWTDVMSSSLGLIGMTEMRWPKTYCL